MSVRAIHAHQAAADAVRRAEHPRCFCPNVRCRVWIPWDEFQGSTRTCPRCAEPNLEAQEYALGLAGLSEGQVAQLDAERIEAEALAGAKERVWQIYGPKAPAVPPTALQAPALKGGGR